MWSQDNRRAVATKLILAVQEENGYLRLVRQTRKLPGKTDWQLRLTTVGVNQLIAWTHEIDVEAPIEVIDLMESQPRGVSLKINALGVGCKILEFDAGGHSPLDFAAIVKEAETALKPDGRFLRHPNHARIDHANRQTPYRLDDCDPP